MYDIIELNGKKVADLRPGDAEISLEEVFAELTTSGVTEDAS